MNPRNLIFLSLAPLAAWSALAATPDPAAKIVVQVDQPGIQVSPSLYGIFFEEINRAGDGGLYAEMVQNRSFEDNKKQPNAWTVVWSGEAAGAIALDESQATGEITMKVVNVADAAHETRIELRGVKSVAKTATVIVLTSAAATDENTFAEPEKVSPKTETLPISGTNFTHAFPGNSLTVIRVKPDM